MSYLAAPQDKISGTGSFVAFLGITFAIAWGVIGTYILWPDAMTARFGEISGSHPFFFLATWAPAIAAFAVVLLWGRFSGLKAFLSRLKLWHCPAPWWAFILIVIPLVFMAGSLIKGGPLLTPLPPGGVGPVLALMLMMLFLGPIEEFGWRGVAQPILQRYVAAFWAGALIGIVWGIWHLPAFYLSGVVFAEWSFLPFFYREHHAGDPCDTHSRRHTREPSDPDAVSLAAHQPILARRPDLGHVAPSPVYSPRLAEQPDPVEFGAGSGPVAS
jgi:membrane protease YdiL (CAAX protease family)